MENSNARDPENFPIARVSRGRLKLNATRIEINEEEGGERRREGVGDRAGTRGRGLVSHRVT